MIAVFSLIRRRDGIDVETFRRHWIDPHGVLVCQFPRLRRYSQNRVAEGPAMSAAARALQLDGFAELVYDSDADQAAATASPAMAACDVDSPQFIGAVVRVVCDAQELVSPPQQSGVPKLLVLHATAAPSLPTLDGVVGHIRNTTLRQRGPKSAMPVLDIPVGAITELWFDTDTARLRAAQAFDTAAVFTIDELRLI